MKVKLQWLNNQIFTIIEDINMEKFESVIEVIGNSVFNALSTEITSAENEEITKDVNILLDCLRTGYVLVQWPESQDYMDDPDAIFVGGSEEKTGSSAYMVPIRKLL